jgi:hypothetical protein
MEGMRGLFVIFIFLNVCFSADARKKKTQEEISREIQSELDKKEPDEYRLNELFKEGLATTPSKEKFYAGGIFSGDSFRIGVARATHFVTDFELTIQLNQFRRDLDDAVHLRPRFGDIPGDVVPFIVVEDAEAELEDLIPAPCYKDSVVWPVPGFLKLVRMAGKTGKQSVFLKHPSFRCERWSSFAVSWRNRRPVEGTLIVADPAHFCPKAEEEGTVVVIGAVHTPTHFAGRDVEVISEKWRLTITKKDLKVDGSQEIPHRWNRFVQSMKESRAVFWVTPGN